MGIVELLNGSKDRNMLLIGYVHGIFNLEKFLYWKTEIGKKFKRQ